MIRKDYPCKPKNWAGFMFGMCSGNERTIVPKFIQINEIKHTRNLPKTRKPADWKSTGPGKSATKRAATQGKCTTFTPHIVNKNPGKSKGNFSSSALVQFGFGVNRLKKKDNFCFLTWKYTPRNQVEIEQTGHSLCTQDMPKKSSLGLIVLCVQWFSVGTELNQCHS